MAKTNFRNDRVRSATPQSFATANPMLTELGCVEDQPKQMASKNSLISTEPAAAGRDDAAALRAKV